MDHQKGAAPERGLLGGYLSRMGNPKVESTIGSSKYKFLAILLVCLLVVSASVWHTQELGSGEVRHHDEFHTYDRVLGFTRMEDRWSVYTLGRPSIKKPPLQYWMSAAFIEAGLDDSLALRLPSMIFAAGTLIATALLAAVMVPGKPMLMPAAVLLMATSDQFWRSATSAMLDTGAAFFTTLGIASLFAALKNPRWWPAFPLIVFVSGMQKSPALLAFLAFALAGMAMTRRWHGFRVRELFGNRAFRYSLLIAVVLGFAWQIHQGIRYFGTDSLGGSVEKEMFRRFAPSVIQFFSSGVETFERLILGREPWIRLLGLVGLLALPVVVRSPYLFATAGIAVFFVAAMLFSGGSVYPRYTLLVLPLLSVGAAWFLFFVFRKPWIGLPATFLFSLWLGGPLREPEVIGQARAGRYDAPIEDILTPLEASLREGETPVLCNIAHDRIPDGAVSVYVPSAGPGRQIYLRGVERLERDLSSKDYDGGAVRGICHADDIEILSPYLRDLSREDVPGNFVLWTASSIVVPAAD